MQMLIHPEEFKPEGKFISLLVCLFQGKRIHGTSLLNGEAFPLVLVVFSSRPPTSSMPLSRNIMCLFFEPSQAGSEMVLRDQRGRMIDVGIPAAAAQLVYTQCLFFSLDYLFAAPWSSIPRVARVPMCI